MTQLSRSLSLWWLAALACAYLFLGLDRYGLLNNNEGLYAEIAREMVQEGPRIIPHLNGVPYIEKPPLLYYLLAGSFSLFGESEFAARLVSVGASAACLGSLLWFAARLGLGEAGRLAALILIGSAGYVLLSRTVMPDMLFTALLNGALLVAYIALTESSRTLWRASLALLALALLTKGLLAIALFGLVLAAYLLVRRRSLRPGTRRVLMDPAAWLLFLAIAVPWHVAAAIQERDFPWFYFINEHVLRFLGMREPHDFYTGTALYHVWRLLLFLLPWPAYLLLLLYRGSAQDQPAKDLRTFLGLAVLVPLAFFSASVAKANYYMVIAMPALALLIALRVEQLGEAGRNRLIAIPIGIVVLGLLVVLARTPALQLGAAPPGVSSDELVPRAAAATVFFVLGVSSFLLLARGKLVPGFLAGSLMSLALLGLLVHRAQEREAFVSARPLALEIRHLCPQCPVYLYKDFERLSALPFYLRKPVTIIDSASNDLEYGRLHSDGGRFVGLAALAARRERGPAVVVVHDERLKDFRASPLNHGATSSGKVGDASLFLLRPDQG